MFPDVRTTLELNDELLRRPKQRAAAEGTTLRAVVERALRSYLGAGAPRTGYRLRWFPTKGECGPGPGWTIAMRSSI